MKRSFLLLACILLLGAPVTAGETGETAQERNARKEMVQSQLQARGIRSKRVLDAMGTVPRHLFVPQEFRKKAYADHPLPIGTGQTISQPYIVALMTESLELSGKERVLEIGTGSGYQAAVLAELAGEVYTIEIHENLYRSATQRLDSLGYANVHTRHGDGYIGWKEAAPFDAIMITAAVDHIPSPLIQQLADGGRLILPLGNPSTYQHLNLITKSGKDIRTRQITGVLFVPMTGRALE